MKTNNDTKTLELPGIAKVVGRPRLHATDADRRAANAAAAKRYQAKLKAAKQARSDLARPPVSPLIDLSLATPAWRRKD